MERYCIVCCEEFSTKHVPAFGTCNHRGVCSLCFLRMRALVREFTCPICKQELEHVVATNRNCTFQDLQIWGESIGPDYTYDQSSRMFFPNEYHTNFVSKLWLFDCSVCAKPKKNVKELEAHLKVDHDLYLCHSCSKHKQVFPAEMKYFTQQQLDRHLRHGDPEEGSQGHPLCQFCKNRYYDKQALYEHLNKDHYSCHVCERKGIMYQYYRDYESLEGHFRDQHLLCEHPECLQRRFVVFDNEIELHAHIRSTHPDQKTPRSIPLSLTGFRYGRGEVEEKTDPSESPSGQWTVEELRAPAQGESAPGDVNRATDEFPELAPMGQLAAYGTKTYGVQTHRFEDDFPALGQPTRPPPDTTASAPPISAPEVRMSGKWAAAAAHSRRGGRGRNARLSVPARRVNPGTSFAHALTPPVSSAIAAHLGEIEHPYEVLYDPTQEAKMAPSKSNRKSKAKRDDVKQAAHPSSSTTTASAPRVETAAPTRSVPEPPVVVRSDPLPAPPGFEDSFPLPSEGASSQQTGTAPAGVAKAKKPQQRKAPTGGGWGAALGSAGVSRPAKTGISVVRFNRKPAEARGASIEAGAQEVRSQGAPWATNDGLTLVTESKDFPALPTSTAAANKKSKRKNQKNDLASLAMNAR